MRTVTLTLNLLRNFYNFLLQGCKNNEKSAQGIVLQKSWHLS